MKKRLFFLPMVAIMMAACSSNETIEVNENKGDLISFRPIVKGVTRAADADLTSNGTSFNVEAFNTGTTTSPYFSNVTFTNLGGTFTSATKYYWPTNNLDFYAYSPTTSDQVAKTDFKTFTITPSTTVSEQVDFIYANTNNKGKGSTGEVTTLNFRHAGAKIAVKVKNSAPNLKFEISGWKVGYLDNTATFTYGDANTDTQDGAQLAFSDWSENTTQSAANTYSTEFTANAIAASQSTAKFLASAGSPSESTDESLNMILIPQTLTAATAYASAATDAKPNGSYIALKMVIKNNTTAGETVADATANDKWAMWPIGGYNWEPGKKYTYTIDLAGGGYYETNQNSDVDLDPILEGAEIKFATVTVDGWSDVEKSPAVNLATLKGMAKTNLGEAQTYADGTYYVDKDGNIHSSSETGYTSLNAAKSSGATGIIAYISNTDLTWDDGVNGGNDMTSQSSITFTGKNILILSTYFLDLGNYAWNQLKNPLIDTSITGRSDAAHYAKPSNSTVWFIPSKSQMISMGCAGTGTWSGVGLTILYNTDEEWTSTKYDNNYSWTLDNDNTFHHDLQNINQRKVTPCYAY